MEIGNSFQAGVQGMQQSQQRVDRAAHEIAAAGTVDAKAETPAELVDQLVELREQELAFKASAEVVRSADKMLSKLVDDVI